MYSVEIIDQSIILGLVVGGSGAFALAISYRR